MMTQKDFVAIAAILNEAMLDCPSSRERMPVHSIRAELIDYFQRVNPRFDIVKFNGAAVKGLIERQIAEGIRDSNGVAK